jgi:hypothetical protein
VERLLWTLLVERTLAQLPDGPGLDERTRDAAGALLGSGAFLDRALVLRGYAQLGLGREAAAVATRLGVTLAGELGREPFLHSPPAAPLAAALLRAAQALDGGGTPEALRELRALLEREDVRNQRVPCARCGRGTVGATFVG